MLTVCVSLQCINLHPRTNGAKNKKETKYHSMKTSREYLGWWRFPPNGNDANIMYGKSFL